MKGGKGTKLTEGAERGTLWDVFTQRNNCENCAPKKIGLDRVGQNQKQRREELEKAQSEGR